MTDTQLTITSLGIKHLMIYLSLLDTEQGHKSTIITIAVHKIVFLSHRVFVFETEIQIYELIDYSTNQYLYKYIY